MSFAGIRGPVLSECRVDGDHAHVLRFVESARLCEKHGIAVTREVWCG